MTRLSVNGRRRVFRGPAFTRLVDVLREDLRLTGTKEGCGEGECGACTVLLDGEPVMSCLVPVCQVEGRRVETIEALGSPEHLNVLQRALLEAGGAQCGICTPGMVMAAWAFLRSGGSQDRDAIRNVLAGNLCRCTGYSHIVDAVARVASAKARPRKSAAPGNARRRRGAKAGRAKRRTR